MSRSTKSHSNMFLTEMIITILFFSLASSVCLRMFAKSHQLREDTKNLNMAINQTNNAAELLKHAISSEKTAGRTREPFPSCILKEYPLADSDDEMVRIYYNKNWKPCRDKNSVYCMELTQTKEDELLVYKIEVLNRKDKEERIYSLDLKLHQPDRTASE